MLLHKTDQTIALAPLNKGGEESPDIDPENG